MKDIHKIAHPLFLLSLAVLIINDWYFKAAFHNDITGKLSDFAGLFAFPFLFSILFTNHKKTVHILTALLFIYWNSALSQPLIDSANNLGIPLIRTIDITDNMALISIFFSYQCLKHDFHFHPPRLISRLIIPISCLAFFATTLPPQEARKYVGIDKAYPFNFSKQELVERLNTVQINEIERISTKYVVIDFNKETNVYHYHDRTDTLALILDYNQISDRDTITFKSSYAEIQLMGNDSSSEMKLVSVYKVVPKFTDRDFRKKAIKQFEKRIVKKIKRQ